ncbi:hypothetical protein [Myxococcus sp. AB036A]|uniref:SbtR family transcriptional regulator n=2 Tax=unclassified Myxococcus TaxID=2648731 RepID=UPI0034CDBC8A
MYTATHRGLAAALLAGPEGLSPQELCCTDMLLEVLKGLAARASSAGAIHTCATAEDLLRLANAIAVANEQDAPTARRVLRLALLGIRPGASLGRPRQRPSSAPPLKPSPSTGPLSRLYVRFRPSSGGRDRGRTTPGGSRPSRSTARHGRPTG